MVQIPAAAGPDPGCSWSRSRLQLIQIPAAAGPDPAGPDPADPDPADPDPDPDLTGPDPAGPEPGTILAPGSRAAVPGYRSGTPGPIEAKLKIYKILPKIRGAKMARKEARSCAGFSRTMMQKNHMKKWPKKIIKWPNVDMRQIRENRIYLESRGAP